jgi:glycine/D-amino acid oxidase-like deaminating enzyme
VSLPAHKKYVIVGAGIHGLSTAYHLALTLENQGKGSGSDVIVLDKTAIGAGASGIACGVVRNNYFQPEIRELIAHSVEIWESDAVAFSYHPVGYLQISCEPMHEDIASVSKQQQEIDYESTFIEGADDCDRYMKNLFHDWQAQGITSVLHEKKGGYVRSRRQSRSCRRDDSCRCGSDRNSRRQQRRYLVRRNEPRQHKLWLFDHLRGTVGARRLENARTA